MQEGPRGGRRRYGEGPRHPAQDIDRGHLSRKKADRTFSAGTVAGYIHSTGRVGSLVELVSETDFVSANEEFKALARDIAMHVAASNPKFLKKEDIRESDMTAAKAVFADEVKDKPEAMKAKILEGKLATYFGDMVLLDQPFVKNPDVTVRGLIDAAMLKFGEKIEVARFDRLSVR